MDLITLRSGNPMRTVLLSVLLFEVIVFGLAIPVMIFNADVDPGLAGVVGGGAALLALVSAGLLRQPRGYPIGWLTQIVGIGLGFLTTPMLVIGAMFAAIWTVSFVLGKRLDARPA